MSYHKLSRRTLILLTVIATCAGLSDGAARTIRVPLTRDTTQGVGTLGQPVINYHTEVDIGTPPKRFKVQFDVGLNDLFVPHYNWNPFKTNLHYSAGFQCKVSSSCIKNDRQIVIDYHKCLLTGKPYDDFMMFPEAYSLSGETRDTSLPIRVRQNFLAVSDASDARFKDLSVDGYFGLGPLSQSSGTINNLVLTLQRANLVENLQFAFWFNPMLDARQGGELTLGGVNTSRYKGKIYWHSLMLINNFWSVGLQQVVMGGQEISGRDQQNFASLSTSVNEVYGPREHVQRIYNYLNTSHQSSGLELVDCRRVPNLPVITFYIDGIPYSLLPTNYIRKMESGRIFKDETCYVAILPSDVAREWTLGINFLSAYYSVFDITNRQIGFAELQ